MKDISSHPAAESQKSRGKLQRKTSEHRTKEKNKTSDENVTEGYMTMVMELTHSSLLGKQKQKRSVQKLKYASELDRKKQAWRNAGNNVFKKRPHHA